MNVPSQTKKNSLLAMLLCIGLVLTGLTMDWASRAHHFGTQNSTLSIGISAVGFIGGVAAYAVNKLDDRR
jgi:hypothetical protein